MGFFDFFSRNLFINKSKLCAFSVNLTIRNTLELISLKRWPMAKQRKMSENEMLKKEARKNQQNRMN